MKHLIIPIREARLSHSSISFQYNTPIKRLVKVFGMVNCTPDFQKQPLVINGFSELMAEVFGKVNGIGVRSAVGMILPDGIPVEIEAMFELH